MEEEKLIKKAQKGENEAFAKLYDFYIEKIYRFIYIKTSNKSDAEDLTQQVFLSAWQSIKSFRYEGHPFSSWLYKIARNLVIDYYRKKKPQEIEFSELLFELEEVKVNFEKDFDKNLLIEKVKSVLKRLPVEQQDVIILKFIDNLSNKEIAKILNKSEGAIRVLQHRALKQLKNYFNKI